MKGLKMVRQAEITLMCLVAAGLSVRADGLKELSFITAMPADKPPVIDGSMDDACWAKGTPNRTYYKLDTVNPPRVKLRTECTVMYDAKGIYVGLRNWEEDVSKLRKDHLKDWDPNIWRDDGGEVYFDPDASGVGFYKFDLSCTGRHYTLWRMDAANIHTDWRAEGCVSAAKIFDDRFEIELFVPWGDFHGRPAPTPGTMWTFNHNRYQWHKWILCCSSPCAGYTTPQNFGFLYFSDGRAPEEKEILAMLEKRLETEWGIEIGGQTWLHDAEGTRPIDGTIAELAKRKAEELKAAEALAITNFYICCHGDGFVPKMDLPLAGQYDFNPPKEYNGYNGWYRHNPNFAKYLTPHLDWGDSAAGDPTKVLFICSYGNLRDMMEIQYRFPIEGMFFPGNFGASGIWEDCISGGTHIDKERQFQSLLARAPDVAVIDGFTIDNEIPKRYRTELFRRVRDEGMGLLIIQGGWRLWNYCKVKAPDGKVVFNGRRLTYKRIGRGVVISDDFGLPRKISPSWWAEYETRAAELFRMIQSVRAEKAPIALRAAFDVIGRPVYGAGTNFIAVAAMVRDGGALFGSDTATWRVRDAGNAIVRSGEVKLAGGTDTGVLVPLEGLPDGEYFCDVIAKRRGGVADALSFPFAREAVVGRFAVDPSRTVAQENAPHVPLRFTYSKGAPKGSVIRYELRDLPYGQVRFRGEVPATGRDRLVNIAAAQPFPTLAAMVCAEIADAASNVIARTRAHYYFPNHRFDDYTLISWDSLNCAGNLAPILAPQVVDEFGYTSNLGEGGDTSALFNARSVPCVAAITLMPAKNGGANFRTLRGFITPWSGPLADRVNRLGGEVNPYDPEVQAIVDEAMKAHVTNTVKYGVCVWNLGDENGYSTDAGHGPKDREPFAKFLRAKYGTIAAFNAKHGTNAVDFATAHHKSTQQALADRDWVSWFDHVQYVEKMYSDINQMLSKSIKRYDPKARVGAEGSAGADIEQTIEKLEYWGPYRNVVTDELIRDVAPDRVRGIWWGGYFTSLRDGFPVQQWEFVLTGTLNADQWFCISPGSSQGAFGPDFCFAPYVERMLPYLKEIRRGQAQLLLHTPFRRDGFAIWYSHASNAAAKLVDEFTAPDAGQNALIRFCYRTGYGVNFVTKRHLKRLDGLKVVFLPGACALSDAEVAALAAFVKKGGLIAADSEPGVMDDFLFRRPSPPLKGLWTKFLFDDSDETLQAIVSKRGISPNRESIAGLPADQTIFRVRELGGMRVFGFKTSAKSLGRSVTINLGGETWVYEVGKGPLGRMAKVEIQSLEVPFRLFSAFSDEQPAPPVVFDRTEIAAGGFVELKTDNLRRESVYRLEISAPGGGKIANREKVFAADGQPLRFQFPFSDAAGVYTVSLMDVATGIVGQTCISVK
ncbi:MAG: hypothetical protein J6T01_03040 [Kiritimatiellae bacterium]|nr:hypothetical protein [Kiritimatiellia bacterium]